MWETLTREQQIHVELLLSHHEPIRDFQKWFGSALQSFRRALAEGVTSEEMSRREAMVGSGRIRPSMSLCEKFLLNGFCPHGDSCRHIHAERGLPR